MEGFHLYQRVIVIKGEYTGLAGVIELIIHDGENKGLWIELDGVFGLKRFYPEEVQQS